MADVFSMVIQMLKMSFKLFFPPFFCRLIYVLSSLICVLYGTVASESVTDRQINGR